MKLDQYSKSTQAGVARLAKKLNITPEEAIRRFEQLFRGKGVSKHFKLFC